MTSKVRFNHADIRRAARENIGFCIDCGASRENCEPDAGNYYCDLCDDFGVYGAEALIALNLVDADGEGANV